MTSGRVSFYGDSYSYNFSLILLQVNRERTGDPRTRGPKDGPEDLAVLHLALQSWLLFSNLFGYICRPINFREIWFMSWFVHVHCMFILVPLCMHWLSTIHHPI